MPTQISGTTGVSQVQDGAVTQADLAANVVGKGPVFSAYQSTLQSLVSATLTKVVLQSEEVDTNNAFDSVTNYRFQPNVAGYYYVTGQVQSSGPSNFYVAIHKSGNELKRGVQSTGAATYAANVACLVYLNGTTDYVELFAWQNGTTQNTVTGANTTYFQGHLVRAA